MSESYSITAVLEAKVDGLLSGFRQARSTVDNFVKRNEATFKSFKQVGAAATAGGLAVAGGLGYAVKVSADFEQQMSRVKAISGATNSQMEQLGASAEDWGAKTAFTSVQVGQAQEYMAQAGWKVNEILDATGGLLSLATAGGLELGDAAQIVTGSLNAFGLKADYASTASDILAYASSNSGANVAELGESLSYSATAMSEANMSYADGVAALGLLADNQIVGSRAGTVMNAVLRDIIKSADDGAISIGDTAVAVYDAGTGAFRPFAEILADVEQATKGMNDEQRDAALSQVFQQQSLQGMNILLGEGSEKYREFTRDLENSTGSAERMREEIENNLYGQLEILKSGIDQLAKSIGDRLTPHIKTLVEFVQSLVEKFNNLDERTKDIIALVATLSAGFLLLVGPIFMLIGFIPSILAGFTALSTVIGAIVSPITLAIAAFVAIGAALVVAYTQFEWFRDGVNAVWSFIKDLITTVTGAISDIITSVWSYITDFLKDNHQLISDTVDTVWGFISEIIESVMSFLEPFIITTWENIKLAITIVWEAIETIIGTTMDVIFGIIKSVMQVITGDWDGAWNTIKSTFEKVWNRMKKFGESVTENIKNTIKRQFERAKDLISEKLNSAKDALSDAFSTMLSTATSKASEIVSAARDKFEEVKQNIKTKLTESVRLVAEKIGEMPGKVTEKIGDMLSAGKDLINGLIDGIKQKGRDAIDAVTGVVSDAIDGAKKLLGIKSPSRVFMDIGKDTIQGFADGMDDNADESTTVAEVILNKMKNEMQLIIGEILRQTDQQLEDLQRMWESRTKIIRIQVKKEMSIMSSDFHTIGKQAIQGLIDGLEAKRPELLSKAQAIANQIRATIQSALDIRSPSRWMRDMIGKNMMIGWIDGMQAMKSRVIAVAKEASEWMSPRPVLAGVNLPLSPQQSSNVRGLRNRPQPTSGNASNEITQHIHINSPDPISPSEKARKFKQASRELAMEWR